LVLKCYTFDSESFQKSEKTKVNSAARCSNRKRVLAMGPHMVGGTLRTVIRELRGITRCPEGGGLADAVLLERYASTGDEAAFEVLLWRHGPMVLGVCRRLLRNEQDSEDAFQATFLALARKARGIANREAVGSWLYKVAYRVALHARKTSARLPAPDEAVLRLSAAETENTPCAQVAQHELVQLVDAAIQQLPKRYRDPVVLCYLEGKTQEQAGRELGWPKGTVSTRLIRAREMLRARLQRTGEALTPTAMLPLAGKTLPQDLAKDTLRTIGAAQADHISVLAQAALTALTAAKWRVAACALLLIASLGACVGWCSYQLVHPAQSGIEPPQVPARGPTAESAPGISPFARLDSRLIPVEDRFAWQPTELVAVLGEHRARTWGVVQHLAFSRDGSRMATAGSGELGVRLWDAETLREIAFLGGKHKQSVNCLAFSPDGKLLASGSWDKHLSLWDLTTLPPKPRSDLPIDSQISCVTFSPDSKTLACGGWWEGGLRSWSLDGGATPVPLPAFEGNLSGVNGIAFSPDSKTLFCNSAAPGQNRRMAHSVVLFDTRSKKRIGVLPTSLEYIMSVAVSADGRRLAACAGVPSRSTETLALWNLSKRGRAERMSLSGLKQPRLCLDVAFSPDGNTLAFAGDDNVHLWSLADRAVEKWRTPLFSRDHHLRQIDMSGDGKRLIANDSGVLRMWELDGAEPKERVAPTGHTSSITGLAYGRRGNLASVDFDCNLCLWDLNQSQPQARSLLTSRRSGLNRIALSADGNTALASLTDGTLSLWDLTKGTPQKKLSWGVRNPPRVAAGATAVFSPDEKTVISCGVDHTIRFWDITRDPPAEKRQVRLPAQTSLLTHPATALTYTQDGSGPLAARWEPTPLPGRAHGITVWDLSSAKPRMKLNVSNTGPVRIAAFSPEGRAFATAGGGPMLLPREENQSPPELRLWRLPEHGPAIEAPRFEGLTQPVVSLAFSPDGNLLASAGDFGEVVLWETATAKKVRQWSFAGAVHKLLIPPGAGHLVTGNGNGTIYVLRLGKGTELRGTDAELWTLLASPDPAKAYPAVWTLVADPKRALAILRAQLKNAAVDSFNDFDRLIHQLDSRVYKERAKATDALAKQVHEAEPALRRRLAASGISVEEKRRIEDILQGLKTPSAENLRIVRSIHTLECIGNPEALALLQQLASGGADSLAANLARAALARLSEPMTRTASAVP
jgi:RNA polymerase sigma factor (sigma-70 family)